MAKETTYTQKEFEEACEKEYQRGREDGYASALDNAYDDLH